MPSIHWSGPPCGGGEPPCPPGQSGALPQTARAGAGKKRGRLRSHLSKVTTRCCCCCFCFCSSRRRRATKSAAGKIRKRTDRHRRTEGRRAKYASFSGRKILARRKRPGCGIGRFLKRDRARHVCDPARHPGEGVAASGEGRWGCPETATPPPF